MWEAIIHHLHPHAELRRAWPLTGGLSAQMTALEIGLPDGQTQKLVLRQHPRAVQEFDLLGVLHTQGLPVPAPLDYGLSPAPYLVMEFIEGQPDFAPADLPGYIRQFAALLARMHAIDARPFLPPSDAGRALVHGDMWPGNVLWKDGKIAAVIDWEDAACGDPLEDVAISRLEMLLFFGVEAMNDFTRTYQALTQIDLAPLREWDWRAAERVEPEEWAAPLALLGRPDITADAIRAAHQLFMAQVRGD